MSDAAARRNLCCGIYGCHTFSCTKQRTHHKESDIHGDRHQNGLIKRNAWNVDKRERER